MFDFIRNEKRTHFAGKLNKQNAGEKVTVMGWVHRRRDLGGLIFIDLRDVTGLVQIVFKPEQEELHQKAGKLRNEYVIAVSGTVTLREAGNINKNLSTGKIEIETENLLFLNNSEPLPVQINEKILAEEDLRLKYHVLLVL